MRLFLSLLTQVQCPNKPGVCISASNYAIPVCCDGVLSATQGLSGRKKCCLSRKRCVRFTVDVTVQSPPGQQGFRRGFCRQPAVVWKFAWRRREHIRGTGLRRPGVTPVQVIPAGAFSPVSGRSGEPFLSLCIVLGYAFPCLVHHSQGMLRLCQSLFSCLGNHGHRLRFVLGNPFARAVQEPEDILRRGVTLFGSPGLPLYRFLPVLYHAVAEIIPTTNQMLGLRVPLFRPGKHCSERRRRNIWMRCIDSVLQGFNFFRAPLIQRGVQTLVSSSKRGRQLNSQTEGDKHQHMVARGHILWFSFCLKGVTGRGRPMPVAGQILRLQMHSLQAVALQTSFPGTHGSV